MHNKSRLKIWVCEYVSAGGLASHALPASLLQEGLLMRDALLADLSALDVDCITSHDSRVAAPENALSQPVHTGDDPYIFWGQQLSANEIDACWVIAPETQGVLLDLHELAQAIGKPWIGCTAEAICNTTSKSRMAEICGQAGVQVLPHAFLAQVDSFETLGWNEQASAGWVIKPDDGAGCEFTYYFKNIKEVIEFKLNLYDEIPNAKRLLLQPYLPGLALSMSVISTPTQVKVIAGHRQSVQIQEGAFVFYGAGINEAANYLPAMQQLAERVHHAIPGLVGYWGADMILTADGQLTLVEVNPRLTTPYIGLSKLFTENPAAMILDAILKQKIPAVQAQSSFTLTLLSPTLEKETLPV
jgi:tyramine---L-glutamate ligase